MCSNKHKTALSALQPRSTRSNKSTPNRNSARKTRTKTRKHKFISLRRELTRDSTSPDSGDMTHHHQLNLFPLHPENFFEEKDIQDENVTCFFDSESGDGATLNGLFWGAGAGDDVASAEEGSVTYALGAQDSEEGGAGYEYCLERAALRNRERDASEEKWVCYSEVASCSAEYWSESRTQGLSLKLDYQDIINAWVDKGPLYIDGEGPLIVPDVLDDATQQHDSSSSMKVPVMGNGDEGDVGQNREARVLRYKEKRQSRLFAKRIRYEVRKLNAEKRPRLKGRFVKRS